MHVVLFQEVRSDGRQLEHLVRAGFDGVDPTGVEVWIESARRRADSFTGRAYPEPPNRRVRPQTLYLVRLRLPSNLRNRGYPRAYRYPGLKTAPWITVEDWRERLIVLAAHEACHVRQFRESLRRSEVEAERWAQRVLAAWRDGEGPPEREGYPQLRSRPATVEVRFEQLSLLPVEAA